MWQVVFLRFQAASRFIDIGIDSCRSIRLEIHF